MNKKGVSEIVSYTLLIVIAIGLSIIVFLFLKIYVFKGQAPQCPPDVSIFINEELCSVGNPGSLQFTLTNKGFFSVNGFYVRFREPRRKIQNIIISSGQNEFQSFSEQEGLSPGNQEHFSIPVQVSAGQEYTLEIQPVVYNEKNEQAVCEAIVTKTVTCS